MITLKNITKEYKSEEETLQVLSGINMHVNKGEVAAIMGRSGCGKSTLLNIVGGIITPTKGEVWIDKEKVDFESTGKLCEIRRKDIGYVVQNFALINRKTVFENIILPIKSHEYKKNHYEKVKILLEELGLESKINKYPAQLSNGEKQRVAIARAIVDDKKIILADEPTGALDYENAENIIHILQRLAKKKEITVLVATHDCEIADKCDRIYHITYGKIENN
ncbi:MAG TPA: ABC transporter ATP-binding protein [Lachnospiraceae bacterium]|nr:ABC transporter ATP-binding protein [Lachnospiraceae bacterium]